MENKVRVGDYVRTENGIIGKLVDEYTFKNRRVCYPEPQEWVLEINNNEVSIMESIDNIIKSSKDITELLEVGDIIEFEVTDEDNYSHILGINVVRIETEEELIDIKDIVLNESAKIMNILTKEQFNQNAYRIGDEYIC